MHRGNRKHANARSRPRPAEAVRAGVHVSIAGGLAKAVAHARELGCQTMQVFSKSPRGWAARPLDLLDTERAQILRRDFGISISARARSGRMGSQLW